MRVTFTETFSRFIAHLRSLFAKPVSEVKHEPATYHPYIWMEGAGEKDREYLDFLEARRNADEAILDVAESGTVSQRFAIQQDFRALTWAIGKLKDEQFGEGSTRKGEREGRNEGEPCASCV
jgi:hypothetical protein